MSLESFVGKFVGTGNWYDSQGNTAGYEIEQTHQMTSEGIDLHVKHTHADGNHSEAKYSLRTVAPYIVQLFLNDKELGYGANFSNCLRFHFDSASFVTADHSLTEVSYQMVDNNKMTGYGSATKNSAGNYIAWVEDIKRIV